MSAHAAASLMSAEAAATSARHERAATPAQTQDYPGGQAGRSPADAQPQGSGMAQDAAPSRQSASTSRQASPLSLRDCIAPIAFVLTFGTFFIGVVRFQSDLFDGLRTELKGEIQQVKGEIQEVKASIDETNANLSARIDETNKRIDETNIRIDRLYERLPPR